MLNNPEEIEQDRQSRYAGLHPFNEITELANHEALDRCAILINMVEDLLLSHPAIVMNPHWFRETTEAQEKLMKVYQDVGGKHL